MNNVDLNQNRRHFLKLLSTGSLFCLGCGTLCAMPQSNQKAETKHKFKLDSKFSFEQLFDFTFNPTIETMRGLEKQIGSETFINMLKEVSAKRGAKMGRQMAKNFPKNDLAAFTMIMKKPNYFWENVLTLKIVEDTEKAFEIKVQECLWAKTFQKYRAEDLGYTMICHPDFAMAKAFNPGIKLLRTKTLMQGHDHCDHRWVFEG